MNEKNQTIIIIGILVFLIVFIGGMAITQHNQKLKDIENKEVSISLLTINKLGAMADYKKVSDKRDTEFSKYLDGKMPEEEYLEIRDTTTKEMEKLSKEIKEIENKIKKLENEIKELKG